MVVVWGLIHQFHKQGIIYMETEVARLLQIIKTSDNYHELLISLSRINSLIGKLSAEKENFINLINGAGSESTIN